MQKLHSLTGIRALAALAVVFYHFGMVFDYGAFGPLFAKGYLGVDLFFILSGFIMSHVHFKDFIHQFSTNIPRFLALRCARILPVHYVMLLVFLGYYVLKGIYEKDTNIFDDVGTSKMELLWNILNVQTWGVMPRNAWNWAAWSISAEWFAYLTFPFLAPLIQKVKGVRTNSLIISGCFLALFLYSQYHGLHTIDWSAKHGLIRVSLEFLTGCSLYNIYRDQQQFPDWLAPGSGALYMICAVLGFPDFVCICVLAPFLLGLARGNNTISALLGTPVFIYFGEVSYSLYMVHGFIRDRFRFIDDKLHILSSHESVWNVAAFGVLLLTVILAAQCLYHVVEVPSRNALRKQIKASIKSAEQPSAPPQPAPGIAA